MKIRISALISLPIIFSVLLLGAPARAADECNQDNDEIKKLLTGVSGSKNIVLIKRSMWGGGEDFYYVKSWSTSNFRGMFFVLEDINTKERKEMGLLEIKCCYVLKLGSKLGVPFKCSNGTIMIKSTIKSIEKSRINFQSGEKFNLTFIDKSVIQGEISYIDLSNNTIVFRTKVRNFEIAGDKVASIETAVEKVKVILLDGSQRIGELLKDSKTEIVIKTILGEESYQRNHVLKIEYEK
jgi:hypothetical protein